MSSRSSFKIGVITWSNLLTVAPLKLFKCALSSFTELLIFFFFYNSSYMPLAHDRCFFTLLPSASAWLITRNSSCRILTLCVDFVCCYCIRWTNVVWMIVFVILHRLWQLLGVWSCKSWIWIWFTSVTIRLSNRFCKSTTEEFFGDTEPGDAMFVLFLDLRHICHLWSAFLLPLADFQFLFEGAGFLLQAF